MLANDGALVYSVDVSMLVYSAGAVHGSIKVEETDKAWESAHQPTSCGGVPAKYKIEAQKLKPGAICINVAQHMNFGDGTETKCVLVCCRQGHDPNLGA